jgi:hypothetical protein
MQMHATVLLYNYYHRKQFPQLEFADPERFCTTASLIGGDALLVYLNQLVHGSGAGDGLSVTDKAVVDACDIAEALDVTKDSPEMTVWPIYKVAVLLLDQTKKICLLEHGSETKGVFSLLEKDISGSSALGGAHSTDLSDPNMLHQIAYSEVELKTGLLLFLFCSLLDKSCFLNLQYAACVYARMHPLALHFLLGLLDMLPLICGDITTGPCLNL